MHRCVRINHACVNLKFAFVIIVSSLPTAFAHARPRGTSLGTIELNDGIVLLWVSGVSDSILYYDLKQSFRITDPSTRNPHCASSAFCITCAWIARFSVDCLERVPNIHAMDRGFITACSPEPIRLPKWIYIVCSPASAPFIFSHHSNSCSIVNIAFKSLWIFTRCLMHQALKVERTHT